MSISEIDTIGHTWNGSDLEPNQLDSSVVPISAFVNKLQYNIDIMIEDKVFYKKLACVLLEKEDISQSFVDSFFTYLKNSFDIDFYSKDIFSQPLSEEININWVNFSTFKDFVLFVESWNNFEDISYMIKKLFWESWKFESIWNEIISFHSQNNKIN